jgi:imidazolonepropionase
VIAYFLRNRYDELGEIMTTIFINIAQLLPFDVHKDHLTLSELSNLQVREDVYLLVEDGVIIEIGPNKQRPNKLEYQVVDCHNKLVTPGLVDASTQLLYANPKLDEMQLPLKAGNYDSMIQVSDETNKTSFERLTHVVNQRLQTLLAHGVTTVGVKTGYGIDPEQELRLLEVLQNTTTPQTIKRLFFAQHPRTLDPQKLLQDYVLVIKQNSHLVDGVAIEVHDQGFNQELSRKFLLQMKDIGLPTWVSADRTQMESAAELAGETKAKAAEYVLHSSKYGIRKATESKVVVTLHPLTSHFKQTKIAPIELLKEQNAIITIASGHNPITAPSLHFTHILQLAQRLYHFTPEQILNAVVVNGRYQLGIPHQGLFEGSPASFVVWNTQHYHQLFYDQAMNLVQDVYLNGKRVHKRG